jgi:hypothetical protein
MIDGMRIWVMSSNMIATTKNILDKNGSYPSVTCCIAGMRVVSRMEMMPAGRHYRHLVVCGGRGWPAAIGTARRKPELQVPLHLHLGLIFDHILAFFKPLFPFLRSFPFLQVFLGVETEYYDV